MEAPSSSFIQFQDLLGERPIEGKERADLTLVGVIRFNKGKQMIKLIEENDGRLHSVYEEASADLQRQQIIDGGSRVLDLGDFDEVKVAQLGMNDKVQVATYDSSQTYPPVNITFTYTDPIDQRRDKFTLDEQDVLDIFTNRSGGHIIFSGAHLPPEEALFIERAFGNKKAAFLFLFHAEPIGEGRSSWGANSPQGLGSFLRKLNREFELATELPLQKEWVGVLDEALANGLLEFPSSVRSELFKTVLLAHARMAAKPGEGKYREFLDLCFPEVVERHGHKILGPLKPEVRTKRVVDKQAIDKSMDRLVVKDEDTTKVIEELKPVPERLKTEKAKLLRQGFPAVLGNNPQTRAYLIGLVNLSGRFEDENTYSDLELLIQELKNHLESSQIAFSSWINFDEEHRFGDFEIEFTSQEPYRNFQRRNWDGVNLIDNLHGALLRRKNRLVELNRLIKPRTGQRETRVDPLTLLKTQRAKQIYTSAGTSWGIQSDTMFSAMNEIAKLVRDCKTEEEFNDAQTLLEMIRRTDYGRGVHTKYSFTFPVPWAKPIIKGGAGSSTIYGESRLIDALSAKLVEKRKQIKSAEAPRLPRPY